MRSAEDGKEEAVMLGVDIKGAEISEAGRRTNVHEAALGSKNTFSAFGM